jgi:8-oxo-dGTP pyrophosphatase MutT (NUDIX family)
LPSLFRPLSRASLPFVLWLKALRTPVAFGVAAIVEDADGRVVLVRHSYQPGWHLPGGGVDRGERPADAILRELREEIGLVRSATPELIGLFTRRVGIATNVIALYRVRNAEFAFKPNFEIREIIPADPSAPPSDTAAGTRRRLAEHAGQAVPTGYW